MNRPSLTAEQAADLIQKATTRMLDALATDGASDNPTIAGAAIGALVGSISAVSDNPEMMLGSIVAVARGIMNGSLVDP